MKPSVIAIPILFLTACYGAAPPRPAKIPLPPLREDAAIVVNSETKTEIENVEKKSSTCPAGHAEGSPQCLVTRYTVAEPVTRKYTQVTYAGEPISYGQLRVLSDHDYDKKLARLDDLSTRCKRANIPRYIGIGLLLGSLVAIPASKGNEIVLGIGYGAAAGGAASYALGYFSFGGRQCNEARRLYHDVDVSFESKLMTVEGYQAAEEMAELAEKFNAQRRPASAMRMR